MKKTFRPLVSIFASTAFIVILIAQSIFAQAAPISISSEEIKYFSIGSSDNSAGQLKFVGGLELTSNHPDFGGLSGLRLTKDGNRLYAVSDNGFWFTGTIKRNHKSRMTAIENADLSCLCKANGDPYPSKHWADAEGVEIFSNKAYVVFERLNRINGYTINNNHTLGPPKQATASFSQFKIAYNTGLEAMARAPSASPLAGKFIAIAEESLDASGNNRAFIATQNKIEPLAITRTDQYSVTDATFLPNGDLLILERRFGLSVGLGMRIRRFDASKIEPGNTLAGNVLMEAGLSSRIDNMEGISTWQTPEGETRIAVISDDNYNKRLQRTLLLEFRLNQ